MHYLLFYDFVADYLQRREKLRAAHLALAWEYQERGELILGGTLDDPAGGAVLQFDCGSPTTVEAFVAADPYVRHGLVKRWRVRPWNTVVGENAVNPIRVA